MTISNTQMETFEEKRDWLKVRSLGIGASDAPVILGLSRWKSPLSLYYEKRGLREESEGETEYREWGLALEPAIIAGYERKTQRRVGPPGRIFGPNYSPARFTLARDPDLSYLLASLDAVIYPVGRSTWEAMKAETPELTDPPAVAFEDFGVLEVKNVDISKGKLWEEAQGPPLEYLVQVQHQMMVTGAQWGGIAALVGGNRFLWADIPRDEELIRQIRALEVEFWNGVLAENPPPVDGSDSTKELLKRLYPRDTGEVKVLPAEALEWALARQRAIADAKEAEGRRQEAENKIKAAIGDATAGIVENGPTFTYKHQVRKAHQVRESEFRVLRQHGE